LRAFLVALPRFWHRYDYITKHVASVSSLPIELVGVDGAEAIKDSSCYNAQVNSLSAGQIGCALSHVTAYRRIVDLGLDCGVVIEDDAALPLNFDAVVSEMAKQIREGEILSLYSPSMQEAVYSSEGAVAIQRMRLLAPMDARFVRTTAVYIIERRAAERLAQLNFPVRATADDFRLFYENGALNHIRVLQPTPVEIVGFESTIGYIQDKSMKKQVSRLLNSLPPAQTVLRLRRQLIHRKRSRNFREVNLKSPLMDANPAYLEWGALSTEHRRA